MRRGHDVVAVAAAPALAGLPDEQVLEWATSQGRCLVTENVRAYEALRRAAAAQGRTHAGLRYCSASTRTLPAAGIVGLQVLAGLVRRRGEVDSVSAVVR